MKVAVSYKIVGVPFSFSRKNYYDRVMTVKNNNQYPKMFYKNLDEYKRARTEYRVRLITSPMFSLTEKMSGVIYSLLVKGVIRCT